MPPSPTPFDTIAWHAAFDATVATGIADGMALMQLGIFAVVLLVGIVVVMTTGTLVAQLRTR